MPQNSSVSLAGLTYHQRTFGCQMNVHDAERVAGMLEAEGCLPVGTVEEADIVIFLTCCVREAADVRLMGQVASIKNIPSAHEGVERMIAVGGCIGQRDGETLRSTLTHVDVVFGTHNLGHLPALLEAVVATGAPQVEVLESSEEFAADLPQHRASFWHAWVPIMTGCNNFCTYCIVPYVRGREKSRPLEEVREELSSLAEQGVKEVTLLGQNVNSYGRDLYGEPRFDEALRIAGESGVERVRFVTSHPKDLLPSTIEVMASYPNIMPQLHLPVQSGSNRILKAMNRVYDVEHYLEIVKELRRSIPDISLSTDIIVGFPGETAEDFEQTLNLVKSVGYAQVFTFIYSKREGTPAAEMEDDTDREVIQKRFDRLVEVVQEGAHEQMQAELGKTVPVLVEGTSKRDESMLSGKSPKNQTVHAKIPAGHSSKDYIGQIIDVHIDKALTWYLQGELVER